MQNSVIHLQSGKEHSLLINTHFGAVVGGGAQSLIPTFLKGDLVKRYPCPQATALLGFLSEGNNLGRTEKFSNVNVPRHTVQLRSGSQVPHDDGAKCVPFQTRKALELLENIA